MRQREDNLRRQREDNLRRRREDNLRHQRERAGATYYRGRQEFGPYFARFTIDVKDWTPTATPNGASFLSADKTCNVVVAVDKNGGANAETLCKAIADQSGMKDAKKVSKNYDNYTVQGTIQGKTTMISVSVEGDKFVCIAITGDLLKGASFIDTLEEKK